MLLILEKSPKLLSLGFTALPSLTSAYPMPSARPLPAAVLDSPVLILPPTLRLFIEHILCAAIALGTRSAPVNETEPSPSRALQSPWGRPTTYMYTED